MSTERLAPRREAITADHASHVVVSARESATPPRCASSTGTGSASRSSSRTPRASGATCSSHRRASTCTTAGSDSRSRKGTRRSTRREGSPHTPSLPRWSPTSTAGSPRCSERWAATRSRRSSCRSWPARSGSASHRPERSPRAGSASRPRSRPRGLRSGPTARAPLSPSKGTRPRVGGRARCPRARRRHHGRVRPRLRARPPHRRRGRTPRRCRRPPRPHGSLLRAVAALPSRRSGHPPGWGDNRRGRDDRRAHRRRSHRRGRRARPAPRRRGARPHRIRPAPGTGRTPCAPRQGADCGSGRQPHRRPPRRDRGVARCLAHPHQGGHHPARPPRCALGCRERAHRDPLTRRPQQRDRAAQHGGARRGTRGAPRPRRHPGRRARQRFRLRDWRARTIAR